MPLNDVDRLLAAFEAGDLLRPTSAVPTLVDLAHALFRACGAEDGEPTAGSEAIAARIGQPEHLVFLLADGVGIELLRSMRADAFLPRHLAMELRTSFPSTTAVALTTLATGEWPARHGIVGWWTYLREIDGAATVVKFERRADERPLELLGVSPDRLLPLPSMLPTMGRDVLSFLPDRIADTVYSRYTTGGTPRCGYGSLRQGVDAVIERVKQAQAPTYTYLYYPRVDAAVHDYGTASHHAAAELTLLDLQIERLAEALAGRARIVLTADHGHLDVPVTRRHLIGGNEELSATLRIAPSYDARVMCFHLRDGAEQDFLRAAGRRLSDAVFLLSVDELAELELLGPGELSAVTRERLGDFVAISRGADAVGYRAATGGAEMLAVASHHSGLTPQEMRIPLVIA